MSFFNFCGKFAATLGVIYTDVVYSVGLLGANSVIYTDVVYAVGLLGMDVVYVPKFAGSKLGAAAKLKKRFNFSSLGVRSRFN